MNCWILALLLCCCTKGEQRCEGSCLCERAVSDNCGCENSINTGSCRMERSFVRDNGAKDDCDCERDRDRARGMDCGCDMGCERGRSTDCGCDIGCGMEKERVFNRVSEREADCDCGCREHRNDARLEPYMRNF